MILPKHIRAAAEEKLTEQLHEDVTITASSAVGGGCINHTAQIETRAGAFFIKWNSDAAFPGMLQAEAKGLQLLSSADAIKIPAVVAEGKAGGDGFLILEWISEGKKKDSFWPDFGEQLARLHRCSADYFGLDHNNYIGSLPQSNDTRDHWPEFFAEQRLEKQAELARNAGKISGEHLRKLNRLYPKLETLFPAEPPALLHGDLWSGNYMTGHHGEPVLIDPAVYYGHREMDLAMMQLFGGFSEEIFSLYQEHFPLEKGFKERTDFCNLYPLLVHVNLFGGGYLSEVEGILRRFV